MRANVAAPIQLAREPAQRQRRRAASAVVVNLLDQKLYNLNPDFLSYTLSKAALQAADTMLAQALAPRVRVVGVAPGITHGVRRPDRGRLRQGAHPDAAGQVVQHPGGHRRGRGSMRLARARRDRHHPAGRWRPAFAAAGRAT